MTEIRHLTYLDAIAEALSVEMERDPNVVVLGTDVGGSFGGAFKVTKRVATQFGPRRVRNMPMTELAFIGAASGMALMGMRPVVEVQFADFISTGFDSIVQFAATTHYRWGAAVPWVIRAPSDGGIRSGPFHSQNPEAWFVHTPGLKVVAPATPADAKGMLLASIRDDNPVIYFEAKPLYRSLKGPVPDGSEAIPIGVARIAQEGDDVTIVTYGSTVHDSVQAAAELAGDGVTVEVIDLRSLKPMDTDAILESVAKTGRALVVHAANRMAGVGAEIAAFIAEEAFGHLDAPVRRLGGMDIPIPFSPPLEDTYRVSAYDIVRTVREMVAW